MPDAPAPAPRRPATRAGRTLARLDRAAHRPWFWPMLAVFPLADYALPALPSQMLLTGVAALHPRRLRRIALTFVVASALGAFLTATAVQAAGPWLLNSLGRPDGLGGTDGPAGLVTRHGPWALALLALLPWTPRAAVLVCALAGVPPWTIALAVLAGRPLPVALLALAGARAPRLLRRSRRVARMLAEVETDRAARDAERSSGGS